MTRLDLQAELTEARADAAHYRAVEDRAAEGLDGMDFGDRCYYGDRAYDAERDADRLEVQLAALEYQGG